MVAPQGHLQVVVVAMSIEVYAEVQAGAERGGDVRRMVVAVGYGCYWTEVARLVARSCHNRGLTSGGKKLRILLASWSRMRSRDLSSTRLVK